MERPDNEPGQEDLEKLAHAEDSVTLEELDLPEDLKAELLRELDSFKESDDSTRRGDAPPSRT
jgi:hypothetical protein